MKFENKLNKSALKESVIAWVLGTDGENGATCGILQVIPWTEDMEGVVPWIDFDDMMDKAIGHRGYWEDKIVDIITKDSTKSSFMLFIDDKVNNIVSTYDTIINELNNAQLVYGVITKFLYVDVNGHCKYDVVKRFCGSSKFEVIEKIWDYAKKNDIETEWDFGGFVDAMYNGNCHLGGLFSSNLENNTKNNK